MTDLHHCDYIVFDMSLSTRHYVFRKIAVVAAFLIERSKLTNLPNAPKEKVSFHVEGFLDGLKYAILSVREFAQVIL